MPMKSASIWSAEKYRSELSKEIFADAGIEVTFKELPPNRIVHEIRKKDIPFCCIG